MKANNISPRLFKRLVALVSMSLTCKPLCKGMSFWTSDCHFLFWLWSLYSLPLQWKWADQLLTPGAERHRQPWTHTPGSTGRSLLLPGLLVPLSKEVGPPGGCAVPHHHRYKISKCDEYGFISHSRNKYGIYKFHRFEVPKNDAVWFWLSSSLSVCLCVYSRDDADHSAATVSAG